MSRPPGYRLGRGGNFERGPGRKGYRGGRKPLHPPGTPLARLVTTVSMSMHGVCRVLGGGNAAKGVRMAVEWAALSMPLWAQNERQVAELLEQRVYGKEQARKVAWESRARLEKALRSFWDDTEPMPPSSVPSSLCDMDDADE